MKRRAFAMKYAYLLSAIVALTPQLSAAQASPDSVGHRNECRLAEQVLTTGSPAPHREWAEGYIPSCGYDLWGRTAAIAVRRNKGSSDLALLSKQWRRLDFLRDGAVFQAAA